MSNAGSVKVISNRCTGSIGFGRLSSTNKRKRVTIRSWVSKLLFPADHVISSTINNGRRLDDINDRICDIEFDASNEVYKLDLIEKRLGEVEDRLNGLDCDLSGLGDNIYTILAMYAATVRLCDTRKQQAGDLDA